MYVFYQIGISIGMILVALAIHILRQSINESSQFTWLITSLPYLLPLMASSSL